MCVSLSYGIMSAKMPSVAYARMINWEAGAGDEITVGSRLGATFVLGRGVPEGEQHVRKEASRQRLVLSIAEGRRKKRYMLCKCQIQTMRELLHAFLEECIQIGITVLEQGFCNDA